MPVRIDDAGRFPTLASIRPPRLLRNIAIALSVSADVLLFDSNERGPDEDFRLRFEALNRLDQDERAVVKELIDGMLLKHEARRLSMRMNAMNEEPTPAAKAKTTTAKKPPREPVKA